MVITFGL